MSVSFIYNHHLVRVKWLKDWLIVDFLVQSTINPANICWPSRLLKTSSRHVLKTFPTCLQHKIFLSFKTSCKHILKTSSRRLGRQKTVTLNSSWRRLSDVSSRRLEDMSSRRLQVALETNKIFTGDICI